MSLPVWATHPQEMANAKRRREELMRAIHDHAKRSAAEPVIAAFAAAVEAGAYFAIPENGVVLTTRGLAIVAERLGIEVPK